MWADLAGAHEFEAGGAAKKRWTFLRDYYVKTKNKKTPSGATSTDGEASRWVYYGMLSFLDGSLGASLVVEVAAVGPASSQLDHFEDEDLDSSFGDNSKNAASLNGAPTPKRIKQEKLAMEKGFINVMEATAHQPQSTHSEESAEELYGRTVGKKLSALKESNPLNAEWAMLEIQRILYRAQCPAHPPQPSAAEQFNYVTGQGL